MALKYTLGTIPPPTAPDVVEIEAVHFINDVEFARQRLAPDAETFEVLTHQDVVNRVDLYDIDDAGNRSEEPLSHSWESRDTVPPTPREGSFGIMSVVETDEQIMPIPPVPPGPDAATDPLTSDSGGEGEIPDDQATPGGFDESSGTDEGHSDEPEDDDSAVE